MNSLPEREIRIRVPDLNGSGGKRSAEELVAFYRDLIDTERSVLARVLQLQARTSPAFAEMVEVTNVAPLKELIQEFEQRLAYWASRSN